MRLTADVLSKIPDVRIINEELIRRAAFAGISIDSRKCRRNDLFFAIKGERFDGHDFVKDVFHRGVKAVVVDKKWFSDKGSKLNSSFKNRVFVLVNNTLTALGELACSYRDNFLMPVLAVGGSNGKTTTKDFVAYVLSKKYSVHNTEGNYNNAIGVPLTVLGMSNEHDMSVVEIGTNHFGEIKNLCRIVKPQFGLLTNIGREHLEFLKNINGVIKEEFELVNYLKDNYGTFFLNNDDRYISKKTERRKVKVFTFGKNRKNNVTGKIIRFDKFYPIVEIKYKDSVIRSRLNMIGSQSFDSALCAAAIGFYFDVPATRIKMALSEFQRCGTKRNELICPEGVWIIDDTYNSNPDSVLAALNNLKKYKIGGKKHIVLADMLELGKAGKKEHTGIGKLVKELGFDNLYTYGEASYNTYKGARGVKNNFYFLDKRTLTLFLNNIIKRNDIVLIKGSRSMRMEEVVGSLKARRT